jgi:MFS superfamily sulfate permease-like transporter
VVAALTTWALVVPQAIAYAQIAGLPPQAGLFTAFAGLLGYALLGTSRQLVVSPTSSTAAISAALVAPSPWATGAASGPRRPCGPVLLTTRRRRAQIAESASEAANPTTTSGPVSTPSTL